jgi:hypothetical protein
MNKDCTLNTINDPEKKSTNSVIKKIKFTRSTFIYNFIEFIVKKVYLINDYETE